MVKAIVQNKDMFHSVVIVQMKPNSSSLQTWTNPTRSSEAFVGLMKSSRNKFSNIIANVSSSRVVADKEDQICINVNLSVQLFRVAIRKGRCETMKRTKIFGDV
jgi:hypothetical protein